MARHPYQLLPQYTRWSRGMAGVAPDEIDPVVAFPFTVTPRSRVATAGSCFAQHIARHLRHSGYTYFVAEDGHPIGDAALREEFGYGVFSARYGNIYTARQLLQLMERAYGRFHPVEDHWTRPDGGILDPLRPTVQPGGFASIEELRADREQHLGAVRRMFEELDYFVFTLGLTEGWVDRRDGAAMPLCPGVAGGVFQDSIHAFHNMSAPEVVRDMADFLMRLAAVNPAAKVILTVSPVPLAATGIDRHVLVSTTYSKAVLRVACEELCARFSNVAYFPSYEIVTGPHARGAYFAPDLRSVTEDGVEHVMRLFFAHAAEGIAAPRRAEGSAADTASQAHLAAMARVVETLCDEEMIEHSIAERPPRRDIRASTRDDIAAIAARCDAIESQLRSIVNGVETWLLPTIAKHGRAIERRRGLRALRDWMGHLGHRRRPDPGG